MHLDHGRGARYPANTPTIMSLTNKNNDFYPLPLSKFDGWIKQLRLDMLEEKSKAFLKFAFPEFSQELGEASPKIFSPIQDYSEGRLRRYSGSTKLPVNSYFTISQNNKGDDGGTLAAELMSYNNTTSNVAVWITDPSVPNHGNRTVRSYIRSQFDDQPCLSVSIAEIIDINERPVKLGPQFNLIVPILVSKVHATEVIDLRIPKVQNWFWKTFGTLESKMRDYIGYVKLKPNGFEEMLPTLLHPAPGGIAFHHAVGAWLSTQGVGALIYPSARRDVHVSYKNSEVVSFYGWNLVGLGGNHKISESFEFGHLGSWLSNDDISINLNWKDSDNERTWSVSGIEERESEECYLNEIVPTRKIYFEPGTLCKKLEKLGFQSS